MEIIGRSADEIFLDAIEAIIRTGAEASPRGVATLEITGVQLQVQDPKSRLVGPTTGRVVNPAFAVAEAMWVLSGSDSSWIHEYNQRLRSFVGEGAPAGAYGPRIRHWSPKTRDQLLTVFECLQADPHSRRAVIQIYDPARDATGGMDVPCTLSYRFLARNGALHMFTTMRSQDIWLGFPYDFFTASVIQEVLASWLHLDLGPSTFTVDSLHLYQRDREKALKAGDGTAQHRRAAGDLHSAPETLDDTIGKVLEGSFALSGGWLDFSRILYAYRTAPTDPSEAVVVAEAACGSVADALVRLIKNRGARK